MFSPPVHSNTVVLLWGQERVAAGTTGIICPSASAKQGHSREHKQAEPPPHTAETPAGACWTGWKRCRSSRNPRKAGQSLVTLLQEKRTTTINNAVTRGIKTTAKMYESSVEWLGEVPENWRIVPAKALFAQSKETRHETDVQLTASQKYGIISQEDYMEKQSYKIVLADKGLENWKHVEPNDFIISLRSFQGGLEIRITLPYSLCLKSPRSKSAMLHIKLACSLMFIYLLPLP